MIRYYLADIDITSYVNTNSLKITDQIQNKANTASFGIIVGGDQPIANQQIKIFDSFEIVSYSGTALVVKKKTLSDIDVLTHFKLRENQEIWLGIGEDTEEKVTISSLVESGDNINITLEAAAGSAHSTGEWAGEKIFGGVVDSVDIETRVLAENVAYSVSCIDYTKEFDRKEVNDSWDNKDSRQIIVAFVTEDLNNVNQTIDLFEYANDGAIQAEWTESGDGSNPTTDTSDFLNGNGTASGVLSWTFSSGTATFTASPDSVDISVKTGASSGSPTKGKTGLWLKFSDYTKVTNVVFRIGSDSSNYAAFTLTEIATDGDWAFYTFNFVDGAITGTPVWTAVDYAAIIVTETGNANMRIDDWRVYENDIFTFFNVEAGIEITSFKAPFQRATVTIDTLAKLNSYIWFIDYDKDIHFRAFATDTPPYALTDGSKLLFDMSEAGWSGSNNDQWYLTASKSQKCTASDTSVNITGLYDLSLRDDGTSSPASDRIQIPVYIETEIPTSVTLVFSTVVSVDTFTYTWSTGLRLGFQLLTIDKASFTEAGSPDWSNITRVDFKYTNGDNDPIVTIDSIWMLRIAEKFYNGDKLNINIDTSQLKNSQTVTGGTQDSSSSYTQVVEGDNAVREWILKSRFKDLTIKLDNNTSTDTCEGGTTTTNITATAHGLVTGDYIVNRTRSNAVRQITKIDNNNFTVEAVASQTTGDTFSKFATSKTVGIENLVDETTVDYVSNFSEKSIRATSATPTLSTGEFLLFTYTEKIDIVTQYKDNTSITRMKLLMGYGDGQFDGARVDDPNLDTREAARDRARVEVEQYKNPLVTLDFTTDFDGIKSGQLLTYIDANKVFSDALLVQKVSRQYKQDYMIAKITCATTLFGIIEYFQKLSTKISNAFLVDDAVVELVESEFPIITISESNSIGATEQVISTETQTTTAVDSTEIDKTTKYQPENIVDEELLLYFSFDAGNIVDLSGQGNHIGTSELNVSYISGKYGLAPDFDGASGWIKKLDHPKIQNIWSSEKTLRFSINPNTSGEGGVGKIFNKDNDVNGWGIDVRSASGGVMKMRFFRRFSVSNGVWETTNREITAGVDNDVELIYDDSSTSNDPVIRVAGVSVAITELAAPSGAALTDVGQDLYIGSRPDGLNTFDGTIDEIQLWTGALSAGQEASLIARPSNILNGMDNITDWTAFGSTSFEKISNRSVDGYASLGVGKTGTGNVNSYIYATLDPLIDFTNQFFNFWYRIKNTTAYNKLRQLRISVSSDASDPNLNRIIANVLIDGTRIGEWCQVRINWGDIDITTTTGSYDITNTKFIRIGYETYNATDMLSNDDVLFDYCFTTGTTVSQTVYGVGAYG